LNRLLLDIGASSIKSVIQENGIINKNTIYITESFSIKYGNKFDSDIVLKEFISHVEKQYDLMSYEEIWMCSEMHNFTLFNNKTKKYSDFFSWRYVSDESNKIKLKALNINKKHHKVSGQTLFSGIPYTNISNLYEKNVPYNFLSLPELILHKFGSYQKKYMILWRHPQAF
jgi:hypothetical protein